MKKKLAVVLMVIMILSILPVGIFAEGTGEKLPTASFDEKVTLNDVGKEMPIRRAVINLEDDGGSNTITRVRLRDVAFALSDTEAKFNVDFDVEQNAIIITSGVSYEQVEMDKAEIDLTDAIIFSSNHKVLVDGVESSLGGYNINGETYSSISQLNKVLGKKFYIRTVKESGNTLISFEKNDIVEYTKETFDKQVKEKKITMVFAGAPWCPWTLFNLEGLLPFQEYIESNKIDAQIIALVHDHQNYYKEDILKDYENSSSKDEKFTEYPIYTLGMTSETWAHLSEIAGIELKYLPSIFFMNDQGELIKYIQGGDDEEEEQEEQEDEESVPYNYIEIFEEIIKNL